MGSITNSTGAPLWLRSPAGVVTPIAAGQQATLVVGNYDVSTTSLPPTSPLTVTQAITFTNVGTSTFAFAAIPPAVAPPFDFPPGGAAILAHIPYTITTISNRNPTDHRIETPMDPVPIIANRTGGTLWIRSPDGTVATNVIASPSVPLAAVGQYQISSVPLDPTDPLPPAKDFLIRNVGTATLALMAVDYLTLPPLILPAHGGAYVLGRYTYKVMGRVGG